MRHFIVLLIALILAACGGGPAATRSPAASPPPGLFSPGVIPAAEQLCQLLTPADWTASGLANASQPTINSDEPGSAYCVYSGLSGGTGGLELDVFATGSITDANLTYDTIRESLPEPRPASVGDAQDAVIDPRIDGDFGAIIVRKGKLVFTITAPASDNVTNQLTQLATLVLARAAGLA